MFARWFSPARRPARRGRPTFFRPQVERLDDRLAPAVFTVANTGDSGPGSLRQAILDANAGTGADTIAFEPSVSGTIPLSSTLTVTGDLTISGPGRDRLTVSGQKSVTGFSLVGVVATISGLTIADGVGNFDGSRHFGGGIDVLGGSLTVSDCSFTGNSTVSSGGGAGIRMVGGSLTVSNSTFTGNRAESNGGGGISSGGSLTVSNCTFTGNSGPNGGGILMGGGPMTVSNSTFTGNSAGSSGGGIYANSSGPNSNMWTVRDCLFSGNSATQGGGIVAASGSFSSPLLTGSTFTGNSALHGGGMFLMGGGTPTVSNSTFAGNTAQSLGGGAVIDGDVQVSNCTVSGNSAQEGGGLFTVFGKFTLTNSIVAKNQGGLGPDLGGNTFLGKFFGIFSRGHNLIGSGDYFPGDGAFVGDPTDLIGTTASPIDPLLGPLQDNGGPTPTMAVGFGSKALDAGDNANGGLAVPAADQRGRTRIAGGTIDIGAFETQPSFLQPEVTAVWDGTAGSPEVHRLVSQANIADHLAAVADITPHPTAAPTAQVIFDLGGNTVTGPTVRVPAGVTLTFVNGTFVGGSPALTVLSGAVVVRDSTLTNATDAPTIRLLGGTLTLRNTVVQESTGFDREAILVEGGTLDLGTPADPGGNTINVNGAGQHLVNAGGRPVTMFGDTWQENGTALAGGTVGAGQAAGIGFWANKNGRALLNALGTTDTGVSLVGQWLAATYPNLYGSLSDSTPDGVWDYFKSLKNVTGTPKLEAQVMATALSAFVTATALNATSLGRATAERYGFVLGNGSLGSEAAPVSGDQASALGLAGGAGHYSVFELLAAANAMASDGWLFLVPADLAKRTAVYDLFASIIGAGGG
jgi:predicted outer membrane repeat protein